MIAKALSFMRQSITDLIKVVASCSEHIAASSEELTSTTQTSSTTANEVAHTIEEIARGASDQAKETESGVRDINDLGKLVTEELKYLQELNASVNGINILKNSGLSDIKDLGAIVIRAYFYSRPMNLSTQQLTNTLAIGVRSIT